MKAVLLAVMFTLSAPATGGVNELLRANENDLSWVLGEAPALLAEHPDNLELATAYGRALTQVLDVTPAQAPLERAAAGRPDHVPTLVALSKLHLLRGDVGKAGSFAQRAVRLAPNDPSAQDALHLAQALVRLRTDRSLEHPEGSARAAAATVVELLAKGEVTQVLRYHADRSWLGENGHANADQGASALRDAWQQGLGTDRALLRRAEVVGEEELAKGVFKVRVRFLWRGPGLARDPVGSQASPWRRIRPLSLAKLAGNLSADRRAGLVARANQHIPTLSSAVDAIMIHVGPGDSNLGDEQGPGWRVADVRVQGKSLVREGKSIEDLVFAVRGPSRKFRERYGRDAPAVGDPYRYRQIVGAVVIAVLMVLFLWWLIGRAKPSTHGGGGSSKEE